MEDLGAGRGDAPQIVRKGSPVMANRVATLLAAMFKRAIKKGWRKSDDGNPAAGIQRVREESRERFLNLEEMNRLQAALATSRNKRSAQAVMLLIATGARRGEVLGATWSQFDLAAGVWSKPSSHTKQKRTHVVPLNAIALGVLREMRAGRKEDSPYRFQARGPSRNKTSRSCGAACASKLASPMQSASRSPPYVCVVRRGARTSARQRGQVARTLQRSHHGEVFASRSERVEGGD